MDESTENANEEHQLWVNLSALTEGNLFGVLPRLIQEMLNSDFAFAGYDEPPVFTLPSDFEWRTKIYHRLLKKQRMSQLMEDQMPEENIVLHEWNIIPKQEKIFCAPDAERLAKKQTPSGPGPITWTVSDIAKAACLLATPPQKTHFNDEQEMRRVYTLIYDVYRYKSILNTALDDVMFFHLFPQLSKQHSRIWLLLYDMYHRSFKKRETKFFAAAQKMFAECGLTKCEQALWEQRVKLAAAIARLRIQNSALRLSELLPDHLQDERVTNQDITSVTCWVNIRKAKNKEDISYEIETKLGVTQINPDLTPGPGNFKWDPHCPHFIVLHPSVRTKLAQSSLVKKHKLIVQNKSFCLGPATFGRIISDLQLTGSVVQTHINSPRTVAYLATVLSQNEKIKKLLAFSAGTRKKEYDNYFSDLGMKNIFIYSEKLVDVAPDATYLEEVIAVFATPPNSYSAVNDPIDLVCSRGGDLTMLEILTEVEETKQTRERVANILDEQRRTLRYAMSRPQIQFVLYETHSELEAENNAMVERAIKDINRIATLHHAALQGKLGQTQTDSEQSDSNEINNNESLLKVEILDDVDSKESQTTVRSSQSATSKISLDEGFSDDKLIDVVVPPCDLFDTPEVPTLCPSTTSCLEIYNDGCYLALLQRKQVTILDNKYMIDMAECRGLFGDAPVPVKKGPKSLKWKKQDRAQSPPPKPKKRAKNVEVDRIAAPTQASVRHSKVANELGLICGCPKNCKHEMNPTEQSRRWWNETTRHLTNLRSSLVKQKILPPVDGKKTAKGASRTFANSLVHATRNIDEIAAKSSKKSNIPVFPKLRLSRKLPSSKDKIPCPITVTLVKFSANGRVINQNC